MTTTLASRPQAEAAFRAMGTDVHVLVHGALAPTLVDLARERIDILESSWSRFRPTSELCFLNACAGRGPVPVSADLLLLVERMQEAWRMTEGRFDPTILTSLTRLGYDVDFATVAARTAVDDIDVLPAPGMAGLVIDAQASTVQLPAGIGIDPGAIGKGLAADLVADELRAAGADGVLVNLGGDIAIRGNADAAWCIGVEDERRAADDPSRMLMTLEFAPERDSIGIATSTTLTRRWAQGRRHHVIDPRTGHVADGDLVQATVTHDQAWQAEVLATAALLQDSASAQQWLDARDIAAVLTTASTTYCTDALTRARSVRSTHEKEHHHG